MKYLLIKGNKLFVQFQTLLFQNDVSLVVEQYFLGPKIFSFGNFSANFQRACRLQNDYTIAESLQCNTAAIGVRQEDWKYLRLFMPIL